MIQAWSDFYSFENKKKLLDVLNVSQCHSQGGQSILAGTIWGGQ